MSFVAPNTWPAEFCLITGAPCSGTSAMAHWLGTHRYVAGFSESRILISAHGFLNAVDRFKKLNKDAGEIRHGIRQQVYEFYCNHFSEPNPKKEQSHNSDLAIIGKQIIVDKEPLEPIALPDEQYQTFLRHVRIIFPEAKFLFMLRDPVRTINSMTSRKWGHTLNNTDPKALSIQQHIQTWCSAAQLIEQYANDPKSYVCNFNALIQHPQPETEQILAFLGLSKGNAFHPQHTRALTLDDEKKTLILKKTRPHIEALMAKGIKMAS